MLLVWPWPWPQTKEPLCSFMTPYSPYVHTNIWDQTDWSTGNDFDLCLGDGQFKYQLGHQLSLWKGVCGFPQLLQADAGLVSWVDHYCFLPSFCNSSFIYHPTICHSIVWLLTVLKNNNKSKHMEEVAASPFYPEDGDSLFLWNIGWHSMDYLALCTRRWSSS